MFTHYSSDYSRRTRPVSSRLAKREEKRLLKQTIFFVFLALIVGLAFVFLVIPASINFFFSLFGSTAEISEVSLPPQTPVLNAPPEAVNQNALTVSGFGEARDEAVLVMNGSEYGRTKISEEGGFKFDIQLIEGENTLSVFTVNAQEKESALSRQYKIFLDTQTPTIEIESPQDGQTIELRENQLTTIKGKTEPKAKVFINDRMTLANSDGQFSSSYNLQEGENKINIKVEDKAGNQTEVKIAVTFRY